MFHSFHERPKTMYQVEVETGIMRPSVCRFVARLKKEGKIKIIKIDVDDLTGCRAQYLSTNYRYWPQQSQAGKQIDMFD